MFFEFLFNIFILLLNDIVFRFNDVKIDCLLVSLGLLVLLVVEGERKMIMFVKLVLIVWRFV